MTDLDETPLLLHSRKRAEWLRQGQDEFNDERFFEAHEAWENLWRLERGRERDFLQGLILAAAHFVHLRKGSWSAAATTARQACLKLMAGAVAKPYAGLDVDAVASALDYNVRLLDDAALLKTPRPVKPPPPPDSFLVPKLLERTS